MKHRYRKICPICCKPQLLRLANHLTQQHKLTKPERTEYLRKAHREAENPRIIYRRFEKKLLGVDPERELTQDEKKALLIFAKREQSPDKEKAMYIQ